jgi:hypothetical protein
MPARPRTGRTPTDAELRAAQIGRPLTSSGLPVPMMELVRRARQAQGNIPIYPDDTAREPTGVIRRDPVVMGGFALDEIPWDFTRAVMRDENDATAWVRAIGADAPGAAGTPVTVNPAGFAADGRHALDMVQRESVVARAGAIVRPFPAPKGRIWATKAATFALTADDDEAPDGGIKLTEADAWDLGNNESVGTYACHFSVTRKLQKLTGDQLETILQTAIARGALGAVDAAVMDAITAATTAGAVPTPQDLAAVGMHDTANLRAVIGTAANPAVAVDPGTGAMSVGGWPAAGLAPGLADAAIVADFASIVILLDPEIAVTAQRFNLAGRLEMTAFFRVKAVLLDPARLWRVGAA